MSAVTHFARQVLTVVLAVMASVVSAHASDQPVDMPSLFPGEALAYAETAGLGPKIEALRTSDIVVKWLASPQYQRFVVSPGYRKMQAVREIAERQLGSDVWTVARNLLGGNLAVAVYPKKGSEQPDFLAVLRTREAGPLADLRRQLDPIITLAADNLQITESLAGVETFSAPDNAVLLARKDNWLVAATNRSLLDHAVGKLTGGSADSKADGLTTQPSYLTMASATDWGRPQKGAAEERLVRAWIDTPRLIAATGGKPLPQKLDNPLGSLLFGDLVELLRTTSFAAATIDVHARGMSMKTSIERNEGQLADRYQAFVPAQVAGVSAPPSVPNVIGGFALYRDFAQWYAHREEFLQEQVLPGFDKFEAGLANLLPGRDFGEDVLPLIGRRIEFVTAPQDYSHLDGEPGVKLPGMALVIELAKPDEATPMFQLLFQTIAAVLNIEAGQQGRQPWVVTSESYHDVQVSYAKYLEKPSGKDLGIVFNFLPASARVGDRFILSSSLPLCKQLVDSLQQTDVSDTPQAPPKSTLVVLQFDTLATMIASDADFFVGRMTQEGRTVDESRAEFDTLIDLLRQLDSVEIATEVLPQLFQVRFDGNWK